ncbi:4-hydroxyphenylpyruvate dioxygenase-like protein [Macrobrachium rosenbergii]|uniref:4-hydroxyphenylpyruvate dioxygenase-like protein n=1 Tax=Macrobrachium rosenbergii TaxID=79674 RepID=UPI0034D4C69F
MSCSVLHHVEVCVKDERIIHLLRRGFGFTPFAYRLTPGASKLALRSGNSVFVAVKRRKVDLDGESTNPNRHHRNGLPVDGDEGHNEAGDGCPQDAGEHWTVFCCEGASSHAVDSVFNVALVVKDVDAVTQRVRSRGGQVIREPTNLPAGGRKKGESGHVRYSIVRSCCGNVVHTLIDKSNYGGFFLPGFEAVGHQGAKPNGVLDRIIGDFTRPNPSSSSSSSPSSAECTNLWTLENQSSNQSSPPLPLSTHIDHVTYVCEIGKSKELLAWYEFCFGMKRFLTNRKESEEEGFVLADNIGLRLKVMEYWKCAESGLAFPPEEANEGDSSLKLVIAEPLPEVSNSHVDKFLKSHGGPGVQHIGLHTPTMVATVDFMARNGVVFRKAPPTYYEEGIKLEEIVEAGHSEEIKLFQDLGILLDTEADVFTEEELSQDKKSYLLQVFTGPVFDEDTFFLEVLQRRGARGFGSGNITALARSIMLHNQRQ